MAQTISISMATYNGSRFLREQLDSLIAQETRPTEIVICDDRSTDDTVRIATDYAAMSPVPIRIERNETNLGWRANFIKAASLCTGDLIAFCDQDDVWRPQKLQEVVQRFDSSDVLMVFHNAEVVDGELGHKGKLIAQPPAAEVLPPMALDPWISMLGLTMTFRRELLQFWPLWDDSIDKYAPSHRAAHDQWVCFLASSLGTSVYSDQQLLQYRQHGGNAMGIALSMSARGKIADILSFGEVVNLRHATAATRVAALAAIPAIAPDFAEQARKAEAVYAHYHELLALQTVVYGSAKRGERLRAAARLRKLNAYQGTQWTLSRAMKYKDIFASGAGPKTMKALHRMIA